MSLENNRTCSNHEEDTDEDLKSFQVVVKEEEHNFDTADIFAHLSGQNEARQQSDNQRGLNNMLYIRVTKIEFPSFGGENVRGWLFKREQFFKVDGVAEYQKCEKQQRKMLKEDANYELSEMLNVVHEEDSVPHIFLNALAGRNTFQTPRVIGYVGKHDIYILIDYGSTHNFLDSNTAKKLGCQLKSTYPLQVTVANVNIRPYRHPATQKDAIESMVHELLDGGVIRHNQNHFSFLIVIVKKKDGSWRMCVVLKHNLVGPVLTTLLCRSSSSRALDSAANKEELVRRGPEAGAPGSTL
uniref:Retrovirus-related Pol polyprotein from transposon 17.6 n=1 Tax=Tanacetum cinerariifolium TaxID=118510 RepID=A0A6L2MAU0_TANCI|nr:retrovirus-related Pol polyprotein from transposon 17.6 [Tanacetum cinerariifolium]